MRRVSKLIFAFALSVLTPSMGSANPNLGIGGHSGEQEQRDLQNWITTTQTVLQSDAFHKNLLSLKPDFPEVYLRHASDGSAVLATVADVSSIVRALTGYRYVTLPLALAGGTGDFSAYAGWTGYADQNGVSLGSMTIGRGHLAHWLSSDLVRRSCAVNTLAHELSHAISTHPKFYNMAFLDDRRREAPPSAAAASYLVGTAAQCTWLQQQGRVSAAGFKACLVTFGTRHFNSLRCNAFGNGEAVEPRTGLPDPATD